MTESELRRRIDWAGGSTVALGLICFALAGVQAAAPALLRALGSELDPAEDPGRALREAWSEGAALSAAVNILFGAALVAIGLGVSRRARWAHPALELCGWLSIAVLAILAKPSLAPFLVLAGGERGARAAIVAVGASLVLAQVAAVVWFLRFWRRPDVRAEFGKLSPPAFRP